MKSLVHFHNLNNFDLLNLSCNLFNFEYANSLNQNQLSSIFLNLIMKK